jgi:hypothetical protein
LLHEYLTLLTRVPRTIALQWLHLHIPLFWLFSRHVTIWSMKHNFIFLFANKRFCMILGAHSRDHAQYDLDCNIVQLGRPTDIPLKYQRTSTYGTVLFKSLCNSNFDFLWHTSHSLRYIIMLGAFNSYTQLHMFIPFMYLNLKYQQYFNSWVEVVIGGMTFIL